MITRDEALSLIYELVHRPNDADLTDIYEKIYSSWDEDKDAPSDGEIIDIIADVLSETEGGVK